MEETQISLSIEIHFVSKGVNVRHINVRKNYTLLHAIEVYLDNMLIMGTTEVEHLAIVPALLSQTLFTRSQLGGYVQ